MKENEERLAQQLKVKERLFRREPQSYGHIFLFLWDLFIQPSNNLKTGKGNRLNEKEISRRILSWRSEPQLVEDRSFTPVRSTLRREVLLEMKVDRVRANHSLRLTASQGTPNIPFHWFQLLGSSPPGTEEKKEDLAVDPKELMVRPFIFSSFGRL